MSEGDQRDVVVRLSVAGRHAETWSSSSTPSLHGRPRPAGPAPLRAAVRLRPRHGGRGPDRRGRNREVKQVIARLSVADAIVRAVAAVRGGDLALGRKLLDAAEKEARTGAKELGDAELAEKAKSIGPLRKSLASLAPPPPPSMNRFGALGAPPPAGMAAPPSPAHAGVVMKSQFDAMRTIQGF